jgi:hypothetical protein
MSRFCRQGDTRKPRIIFAVFMIVAGILLFLANLGLFPIHRVWEYWPLIVVAVGFSRISSVRRPAALISGGMIILVGILFTLVNAGVFPIRTHDNSWPLSILFLALGIGALAKVFDGGPLTPPVNTDSDSRPAEQNPPWPNRENWLGWSKNDMNNAPLLDNFTLLGSINRRMESVEFQGGSLSAVLGSIEIDLRRARMPEGQKVAYLDANALMGAIKLRVPETWRIVWNGANVMGAFEDKTIPPNTGADAPQLIVTGSTVMGSIEVES